MSDDPNEMTDAELALEAARATLRSGTASHRDKNAAGRLLLEAAAKLKSAALATVAPEVVILQFNPCPKCGATAAEMAAASPRPERDPAEVAPVLSYTAADHDDRSERT